MERTELLEATADAIETEWKRWEQQTYRSENACGTTYCIAGWICTVNGDLVNQFEMVDFDGVEVDPADRAAELIGLSYSQKMMLFFDGMRGYTTAHQKQLAAKEVAEWLRSLARGEPFDAAKPDWWSGD